MKACGKRSNIERKADVRNVGAGRHLNYIFLKNSVPYYASICSNSSIKSPYF